MGHGDWHFADVWAGAAMSAFGSGGPAAESGSGRGRHPVTTDQGPPTRGQVGSSSLLTPLSSSCYPFARRGLFDPMLG
jgi:hypothetical protein